MALYLDVLYEFSLVGLVGGCDCKCRLVWLLVVIATAHFIVLLLLRFKSDFSFNSSIGF